MNADRIEPFGVWPENELAVDVAEDCHWERQNGAMGGRDWQGVRGVEVEAVMRTWRVPPRERLALLHKVRRFIDAACSGLNKLEAQRAEENRS